MIDEPFNYVFTEQELKKIVLFFRKNDSIIPSELGNFKESIESYICNSMSINEAEVFFNENS